MLVLLAGVALGIYIIVAKGKLGGGVAFCFAGVVLAGIIMVFRDPPPPDTSGKDPGAINFGGS